MNRKQRHILRKFLRELEVIKGRHTELVSVYIPAGYDMNKIINHLQQEQGTATNIKDARTRKNVIDSLEKTIRHLKLFKKTPDNGLAVFAGNASENESKIDIRVWSIEPPGPLNTRMYRCDQTFVLDILKEMLDTKEMFGLIVLDRREASLGFLKGTRITADRHLTSGVPGKTRAGGQCLNQDTIIELADSQLIPLEELEEEDIVKSWNVKGKKAEESKVNKIWKKSVDRTILIRTQTKEIESSKDHIFFIEDGSTKIAEELTTEDKLLTEKGTGEKIESIKKTDKKIELIDIEVEKGNFIANGFVVHNSAQRFHRIREGAAKEFYKRIAEAANKEFLENKEIKGIIIGGPGPTKEEFMDYLNNELKRKVLGIKDVPYTDETGLHELVEKSYDILLKEEIIQEKQVMTEFFELLAKEPEKTSYGKEAVKKALEMGVVEKLLLSEGLDEQLIEEFEEKAEEFSTQTHIISIESREGSQLKSLGGVAAILRFAI